MARLAPAAAAELDLLLADADRALARGYPGDRPGRQPVHTAYVPADRYGPDLPGQWGRQALQALQHTLPQATDMATVMGLAPAEAADVRARVAGKLAAEPVEDLRLDFEDGYGDRGDAAEDADARTAAATLAAETTAGRTPPFIGLRCKSLEAGTRRRAIATLDIFIGELAARGPLPAGFVVTLPKVTSPDQVRAMSLLCARLEEAHGLADGQLRYEVQAETPQLILGADGAATIARCLHEGGRRLTGVHYGTYDYSAALGIAARYQSMEHPRPTTPGPCFRWRRPGPGSGCRMARLTCCRSARPTRCARPGGSTPGSSGAAWSAGSTRAGTCTRPSWSAGTRPPTASSARAWRWPATGWPATPAGRPAAYWRSPPRRGRWPATWFAGWTAARSGRMRWRPGRAWTGRP